MQLLDSVQLIILARWFLIQRKSKALSECPRVNAFIYKPGLVNKNASERASELWM